MKIFYKESFIGKFIPIIFLLLLIINIFVPVISYGATYDLSDYKNQQLTGDLWVIVHARSDDKIYLITAERNDYKIMLTDFIDDGDGTYHSRGNWLTCYRISDTWYNGQAGTYVSTFNPETSKFEGRVAYGIGGNCFQCGECDIIASGCNIYAPGNAKVFFHPTSVPSKVHIKPTLTEMLVEALAKMVTGIVENLKMIIPIGLVVLSIGLLILLVKSVILHMI